MRPTKIPRQLLNEKVWESLCSRMDPATHRVRPSWLTMMREIGVCRQRIADVIRTFKAQGKIIRRGIVRLCGFGVLAIARKDVLYFLLSAGNGEGRKPMAS